MMALAYQSRNLKIFLACLSARKQPVASQVQDWGLLSVKEIAEQHEGNVWFEVNSEKGITFFMSISKKL